MKNAARGKINSSCCLVFSPSSCSYTYKTFGQVLDPRAAVIELSLVTICGRRERTDI